MKRGAYQRETPQLGLELGLRQANEGVGDEADFYPTPAWATHAILRALSHRAWPMYRVLDPCAGDGAMLRAARDMWVESEIKAVGLELHEERAELARASGLVVQTRDALAPEPWPAFDLALMNPPFKLAEAFVRRAIMERGFSPGRRAAALLRLAFLESAERVALHRAHPADVYVFANRPQFIDPKAMRPCPKCKGSGALIVVDVGGGRCGSCNGRGEVKGGTDSTAYAWFVYPGEGRWFVLDDRDPAKKKVRR